VDGSASAPSCKDNVIGTPSGSGSGLTQAMAFDGTNVYIAVPDSSASSVGVWSPQGGQLAQVAAVPIANTLTLQPTALAVDNQAVYVEGPPTQMQIQSISISTDVGASEIGAIFRQPLGATASVAPFVGVDNAFYRISPVFVDDGTYLYYMQLPTATEVPQDALQRIAKSTSSTAPQTIATEFFYGTDPQAVLAVDSSNVYILGGWPDMVGVSYTLRAVPSAPAWDPNDPNGPADQLLSQAAVILGDCTSPPLHLEVSNNQTYALCADASYTNFWIMSIPALAAPYAPGPAQPPDQQLTGTVVTSGTSLVYSFVVANGYVYYADVNTVYKVPAGGGSSSVVLHSEGVAQLLVGNNTLYVASSCGVQAIGI
jgi:hypothetical protein